MTKKEIIGVLQKLRDGAEEVMASPELEDREVAEHDAAALTEAIALIQAQGEDPLPHQLERFGLKTGLEKNEPLALTEKERRILSATGAKWVARSTCTDYGVDSVVFLLSMKPSVDANGKADFEFICDDEGFIASFASEMFPAIKCGDLFSVNELLQD